MKFIFYTDKQPHGEEMTYAEYLERHDLRQMMWEGGKYRVKAMDGKPLVVGRNVFLYSLKWLEENEIYSKQMAQMVHLMNSNPLQFFLPSSQQTADFINDNEHTVNMLIAPNRTGKTCHSLIRQVIRAIPTDPSWSVFTENGVEWQEWTGPKKIALMTYKWQLHKNVTWQELRRWIPDHELGKFSKNYTKRGKRNVSWDRNARVELKCGSVIQFYVYQQSQEQYESDVFHLPFWDEQGYENLFDAVDERTRTVDGTHTFGLTPHKVEGREDTGAGSWIHQMAEGHQVKGHDVKTYHIGIEEVPDWIYPETQKKRAFEKWIEEPKRTGHIKVLREGEARFFGKWHTSSGLIFDDWDRNTHFIDRLWDRPPREMTLYRSIDYGDTNPTAMLCFAVDHHFNIYVYREYYKRGLNIYKNVRNMIALCGNDIEEIKPFTDPETGSVYPQFREKQSSERFVKTVLDSRSKASKVPGTSRDIGWFFKAAGILCKKSSGSHAEITIPAVKELLVENPDREHVVTGEMGAPRMYVFNDLLHFAEEIEGYIPEPVRGRIETKNMSERPRKYKDHLMSCLLYAGQIPLRYLGSGKKLVPATPETTQPKRRKSRSRTAY